MKTVFEYSLSLEPMQKLQLPNGAEIIHVDMHEVFGGLVLPVLWAAVDTNEKLREFWFSVIATGHEFPKPERVNTSWIFRHIGTARIADKPLMWHVFEVVGEHSNSFDT